jgi:hypothetical protein
MKKVASKAACTHVYIDACSAVSDQETGLCTMWEVQLVPQSVRGDMQYKDMLKMRARTRVNFTSSHCLWNWFELQKH